MEPEQRAKKQTDMNTINCNGAKTYFQQMVLKQLDIHMGGKKKQSEHRFYTFNKIKSNWTILPKYKT